ncbi:hypothetical protein [Amycolatopsis sp. CA-128772]|uniref:hypothetical protein n=1 Tax=Amycolatopsis sp. CA-128772 TaxID=2073159 RepID=UPI0011B01BBD|nr:hypothetical protein [Amycolatopsis sp. CA-128772]
MTGTDVAAGQLGRRGAKLGSGGQAHIHELPEFSLPDVPGPLVYKQYKPGKAPKHGMGAIINLRSRLASEPAKLARLDIATTWPVRQVVDDDGAVLGLILRRIPESFIEHVRLPSGDVGIKPREAQFLFIPPDRALRLGTPAPSPAERLTVCRDFAATLAFLHGELGVAFGDVNARNAVFRLGADPTVMFVDCDAVRKVSEVARQLNAPDWEPPEGPDVLNRATDLYKLGLFVLRCLTPGPFSSVNRDPGEADAVLDAAGRTLLAAALQDDPAGRPSAGDWERYLRHALGEPLGPPTLDRVAPDRTIVAAGEPLTISWTAGEAATVEATGAGIAATSVPGTAGTGTIALRPARTGRIAVTARNRLGSVTVLTEPVAVFDVPSFDDLPVLMPRLDLPRLAPAQLPAVGRVLPEFPRGAPVPLPPMAHAVAAWTEPDFPVTPVPVVLPVPPPVLGPVPPDLTTFFAAPAAVEDPAADQEVHP